MFQFVTVRPPRQVADDPSGASINLRPGKCSLADLLRKIAATRADLRHALRRPGELLWLLHALSPRRTAARDSRAGIPRAPIRMAP